MLEGYYISHTGRVLMKNRSGRVLVVSALALSCTTYAFSQNYRQLSTVHDGSGIMSTSTVLIGGVEYRHVSAAGQPGGIFTNANGSLNNYAGFLQAVDIKKWNQTDIYGNPYELTPDNDVDGLTDLAEIEGDSFNPNTPTEVNIADTDGDGIADGGESIAETDPTDENINLEILSVDNSGGTGVVTYLARGSKLYHIRANDGSYQRPATDIGTDQEAGGSGAWLVRTNVYTDTGTTTQRTYAIEAQR
jgi:hypothetical protein